MLSPEDNTLLTRVGPHTPMGQLMRQYWIPALLSSELPHPDASPVRVMLLGEKLIAFRDSENRIGLVAEKCPHRGVSLFFGQNKDCGLRCPFHGWKFDVHGQCTDMPLNPNSKLKDKIKIKAYPCEERNGLIWTYMGPRETPPPLPDLILNLSENFVSASCLEGNWLQHLESDLDFSHIHYLHDSQVRNVKKHFSQSAFPQAIEWMERSLEHRLEVEDTAAGCAFAVSEKITMENHHRNSSDQPNEIPKRCYGIGQFMFPFYAMLSQSGLGHHWTIARVPMDDFHTMCFSLFSKANATSVKTDSSHQEYMLGKSPHYLPNTTDWFGRFRRALNPQNDFGLNRDLQKDLQTSGHESGLIGLSVQDYAMSWSMGPIADRSQEHLVADDLAIVRVRQRLLKAVRELSQAGKAPPAVDQPESYRMKHGSVVLPEGSRWMDVLS